MVVRAVVHARLLGLRILSLDARVVVGGQETPLAMPVPELAGSDQWTPIAMRPAGRPPGRPDLSRAIELLAVGAETLERSRSVRTQNGPRDA